MQKDVANDMTFDEMIKDFGNRILNGEFSARVENAEGISPETAKVLNAVAKMVEEKEMEIQEKQTAYLEAIKQYESLFFENASIMLLIDPVNGEIVDANKAACDCYGYSLEDIKRKNIKEINIRSRTEIQQEMQKAKAGNKNYFLFKHKKADGTIIPVEVYSGKITIKNRPLLYSIIHDISERVEAENALIESEKRATAANQAKSEFLASMSHEIRTPMNGVIGFSELLCQTKLDALQKSYLKNIMVSGDVLLHIINDVLDYSKMEAGKLSLDHSVVDLSKLLDHSYQLLNVLLNDKNVEAKLLLDKSLPQYIVTDEFRLTQVINNLISNAVKFTEKGFITITAQLIEKREDIAYIKFSLSDTGKGIAKQNRQKIFSVFTQEDASITRKYGGTGLGLAITNGILNAMNSTLMLDSEEGQGSTFYFILPVKVGQKKENEWNRLLQANKKIKNPKASILVAEDNMINFKLVKAILHSKYPEMQIDQAKNGNEVLQLCSKKAYDFIFMDIRMPEMDGYQSTRLLRQKPYGKDVPIVALTASVSEEKLQKTKHSGMNAYMLKPFKREKLFEMIEKYLS